MLLCLNPTKNISTLYSVNDNSIELSPDVRIPSFFFSPVKNIDLYDIVIVDPHVNCLHILTTPIQSAFIFHYSRSTLEILMCICPTRGTSVAGVDKCIFSCSLPPFLSLQHSSDLHGNSVTPVGASALLEDGRRVTD